MDRRPPKPDGVPWLVPHLTVRDVSTAVDFYVRAFGFEKSSTMASADGRITHAELRWKDAMILLGCESLGNRDRAPSNLNGTHQTLYVYVDDLDEFHQRAVQNGASELVSPRTEFWGDRICLLVDPDGHPWMFAQNVADPRPLGEAPARPGGAPSP